MRRIVLLAGALLALGAHAGAASAAALPPIHHVYVIVLENKSAATTFGPASPAPYLARTLRGQGAYLPNYYGIGHFSNDNYIAMISGQAPNPSTQTDCQTFADFLGSSTGAHGQMLGAGCVYPASIPTLASQLKGAGLTWRDYNESMGADPMRETAVCGHPPVDSRDHTQAATATDQYATRHNPFVYFHGVIDDTTLCDTHVVNLDPLPQDLSSPHPPSYSFITPNLCNDGHDAKCANGGPGGLPAADAFLRKWVPRITGSTAFKRDSGLLIVTFDESDTSDSTACCGEIPGPASPKPGLSGPGGGDVGAVLVSPFIRPGTVTQTAYNHYTMLRSVEDLYGLSHIGYAGLPGGTSFGSDIFACAPAVAPVPRHGRDTSLPPGSEVRSVRVLRHGRRRTLTVYSVGASSLRVSIGARHRHGVAFRRSLAPCQTYTYSLPRGSGWRLTVSASPSSGGTQTVTLRY